MKKHLTVAVLTSLTILVFLVIWLTPHFAMNQLEVENEVGNRSLLDAIKITGVLSDKTSETPTSDGEGNLLNGIHFNWFNHQISFLQLDFMANLNQVVRWSKQEAMEHFPFWNRPNIDRKVKANTLQNQEFWFNIDHNKEDRMLSYTLIQPNESTYQEFDYELEHGITGTYTILSYAQTDETMHLMLQDANQDNLYQVRQIDINLTNGDVTNDQTIRLEGLTEGYISPGDMPNNSHTPAYFSAYVYDEMPDRSTAVPLNTYQPLKMSLLTLDPSTHELTLIELGDLTINGDDYFTTVTLMVDEQLFTYAMPKIDTDHHTDSLYPPLILAYDFETATWSENYRLSANAKNSTIRVFEGHYYWANQLDQETIQLIVYDPMTQSIAYQADWSFDSKNDLAFKDISYHVY